MFLPSLNRIGQKMKKQHLIEYRMFSTIFDSQPSKDDGIGVIVKSFWFFHAKLGGDWTTNKAETVIMSLRSCLFMISKHSKAI